MQHVTAAQHTGACLLIQHAATGLPHYWLTTVGDRWGVLPCWGWLLGKASNSSAVYLSLKQPQGKLSKAAAPRLRVTMH